MALSIGLEGPSAEPLLLSEELYKMLNHNAQQHTTTAPLLRHNNPNTYPLEDDDLLSMSIGEGCIFELELVVGVEFSIICCCCC